jgi:uncharacterized protein YndB with AHSA1/START domain
VAERDKTEAIPAESEFVVTRVFDAPRALVWKAWTESERLAQWWGPKSFTVGVAKLDLRTGGVFHYSMETPDGRLMWGRFVYREIVPPERLVFISSFADEKGEIGPNPWLPDWPREVLNVLALTEEAGKTRLLLRAWPLNATEAQLKGFANLHKSMQQGFAGTFDKLEDYLAKA